MYVYACVSVSVSVYVYVYTCACTCTRVCVYMHACVHACTHACVCIHCICVCVCGISSKLWQVITRGQTSTTQAISSVPIQVGGALCNTALARKCGNPNLSASLKQCMGPKITRTCPHLRPNRSQSRHQECPNTIDGSTPAISSACHLNQRETSFWKILTNSVHTQFSSATKRGIGSIRRNRPTNWRHK